MFEGANKNLIVYSKMNLKNQIWNFDPKNNVWYNTFTNNAIMLSQKSNVESGANVVTGPMK